MINIQAQILDILPKMPLSLQKELLHYAEYLQDKYNQNNISESNSSDVVNDFRISWHEAMTEKTIPVSQLWKDLEDEE